MVAFSRLLLIYLLEERSGYLSVRTAEDASEKQSSLKARLRNGLTYLLTYL